MTYRSKQRPKRTLLLLLLALFLVGGQPAWHSGPTVAAAPATASAAEKAKAVDRLFTAFIDKAEPGAAVIVIQRGKILYQAAYGLADVAEGVALTPQHIFHIGSVGKQFTAIAIMQLHQAGKLDYDDAIRVYLPELPAWADKITIRHLLHHTSGLGDYTDAILDKLFQRTDTPTNADAIAVLSTIRRVGTPGEQFEYSNMGYDLLGSIIARVSGQSFERYLDMHIFKPLGMQQTFSVPNARRQKAKLVAHSYEAAEGEPYDDDPLDGLLGSGSVYSTVGDMYLYDQALYTNKLVKQTLLAEAFKSGVLNNGRKTDYGFAFELETWQKKAIVAHSGAWLAFLADYVRFPKEQLSVIVLLNRNYDIPDEPRLGLQVAKIYLGSVKE
jgi:CubicO group peptidase (beta-lactamase class C family)